VIRKSETEFARSTLGALPSTGALCSGPRLPVENTTHAPSALTSYRPTSLLGSAVRLALNLTDAFCGFKCYRASALSKLRISEPGYAMPLEVWVQAAHAGLKIIELPVPLIYLDEKRSFGGVLDDAQTRLEYYHLTLDRAIAAVDPAPGMRGIRQAPAERSFCVGTACGE